MPPNSNIPMHQPDEKTAENTLPPAPAIDSGGDADREHETGEAAGDRERDGWVRHERERRSIRRRWLNGMGASPRQRFAAAAAPMGQHRDCRMPQETEAAG